MRVEEGVQPPQALLARAQELIVQQRNGRREDRAGRAGAADEVVAPLPRDDDICSLCGDVGEATTAAVEITLVLAADAGEVGADDVLLEVRSRVVVGESTAGETSTSLRVGASGAAN